MGNGKCGYHVAEWLAILLWQMGLARGLDAERGLSHVRPHNIRLSLLPNVAGEPPYWKGGGVRGTEPADDDDRPYFFLSYAHAIRGDATEAEDNDVWISQLFRDLSDHIAQLTGRPASKVGFMDRELRSGSEWPWRMSRSLAACRVFVPLYSRRYFQDTHCGQEWFAFRRRALNDSAIQSGHVNNIIPILWSPVREEQLPSAAKSIQVNTHEFGQPYADYGFFAIMKLSRFRDDYEWAVLNIARRICDAAEESLVPVVPPLDYDALPSAFDEGVPKDMAGDKPLRLIVAAPHRGNLPTGRGDAHYGRSPRDWNPYAPDTAQPLADFAIVLAKYHGYRPEVSDLYEQEEDLLSGDGPATGPAVLLVDPWEATQPRCQRILTKLDELNKPWIQIVVVWNRKDSELAAAESELRIVLETAMPVTLKDRVRPTALPAVRGVPSLDEIAQVLGDSMRHAARQYLKFAHSFAPALPQEPDDAR
jgi:FxsC-like protein